MKALPVTIYDELVDGLTLLINARLAFAPRNEKDIDDTLRAWEIVLANRGGWDEKDNGRVITAFIEMSGKLDKFPPPKTLFEFLPPRPPPPALLKPNAVPCPPHIAAEISALVSKMTMNKKEE